MQASNSCHRLQPEAAIQNVITTLPKLRRLHLPKYKCVEHGTFESQWMFLATVKVKEWRVAKDSYLKFSF